MRLARSVTRDRIHLRVRARYTRIMSATAKNTVAMTSSWLGVLRWFAEALLCFVVGVLACAAVMYAMSDKWLWDLALLLGGIPAFGFALTYDIPKSRLRRG